MKSPIVLLTRLWTDVQRLNPDVKGLDRDLITIKHRFENEGYGFLTITLPALDEALLRGLASGKFACPIGFKTIRGGAIPRFLSGMLCKVFEPNTGILKDDVDFGVLKDIHNILQLFKKTQLSPEDEDSLHKKAVEEFYQCDENASQITIPDRHDHLIGRVCKLILNTLNSKDVQNAAYRHGPGSVEEGLRANQKWHTLSLKLRSGDLRGAADLGLDVQTQAHNSILPRSRRVGQMGELRSGNGYSIGVLRYPGLESGPGVTKPSGIPLFEQRPSRRSARLVTVAKNSSSRRTITVEPLLGQFTQQGLRSVLLESINECRILSNCIALTKQSYNQDLALQGSRTDDWATIDLKSASDLLSVKLVESVFRHHGLFFDHMMDCRSTDVYSDLTEAKPISKFAGMGNALTFPVQSICFAVICIAAIHDQWGTSPTYWSVKRASRLVRVYGDDIIVGRRVAHQVVDWLQQVGLKINLKKSFLEGNFKESCGVEAFRGVNITPRYLRYRPDDNSTDPNVIASLVSTSNQLWMEGLYEASTCLKEEVENRLGTVLPLVSKESGSLGWHSRIDATNAHKWCKRTQQLLVKAFVLKPVKRSDRISGYAALLKFFCTSFKSTEGEPYFATWLDRLFPQAGNDVDHLSKTPIRFKSRIVSSWVPALARAG